MPRWGSAHLEEGGGGGGEGAIFDEVGAGCLGGVRLTPGAGLGSI